MKTQLVISCSLVLSLFATTIVAQDIENLAGTADHELIRQADSLISNYKFDAALGVLSTADSLNKDILLLIAYCNFRLGASRGAIRPYERVLQMDSTNITALNHLGQLYTRDGDFKNSMQCFLKLISLDSTNSFYCKQAGSIALRLNNATAGRFWLKRALHFNPADVEASLTLGNLLMEMGQYQSVDSIIRQAQAVDPEFKPIQLLSAKSSFEQEDYISTIATINKMLESSDTTGLLARMLGVSFFHREEYNQVVACMQFLIRNRYDFEWVYYYMGAAFRGLGDASGSIGWFKLAVQKSISENTKTYYAQLGQSYEEVGDYQAAIRAYRAAYNYSQDGILLYHLARNYDVYYKDKTTALEYYKKYLESDDTIRLAREYAKKRMQDMGHF